MISYIYYKNNKKLLMILSLILLFAFPLKVSAFYPSTHRQVALDTAQRLKFSREAAEIYASGAFVADMGRFYLDKKTEVETDTKAFLGISPAMLASSSPEVQLWMHGWSDHVLCDRYFKIPKLSGPKTNEDVLECFANCSKFPFFLYVYPELIQDCYEKKGWRITTEEIYEEIFKLFIFEKIIRQDSSPISGADRKKMAAEVRRVSKLCGSGIQNFWKQKIPAAQILPNKEISLEFSKDSLGQKILFKLFDSACHLEVVGQIGHLEKIHFHVDDKRRFNTLCYVLKPVLRSWMKIEPFTPMVKYVIKYLGIE
ncbi:MAG: hypothetical protein LBT69_05745 [Lactobacillales bacterium]|nr:hypothetical protein [Lactobacillales bacterium]